MCEDKSVEMGVLDDAEKPKPVVIGGATFTSTDGYGGAMAMRRIEAMRLGAKRGGLKEGVIDECPCCLKERRLWTVLDRESWPQCCKECLLDHPEECVQAIESGPQARYIDLVGGKQRGADGQDTTNVAKIVVVDVYGIYAPIRRADRPPKASESIVRGGETIQQAAWREFNEEVVTSTRVQERLANILQEHPKPHSRGVLSVPGGGEYRMHLWVLPLEQGEMDAMRLTAAGSREMMHEESRSLASILTNMHRTGRTTYADLLMAALLQQTRVSAMLEERSEQQRKQRLREEQVRFFHQVKPGEGSVPSQVKRDLEATSPQVKPGEGSEKKHEREQNERRVQVNSIQYMARPRGLLDDTVLASVDAIVQQENCISCQPKGLARAIADRLPYGNSYQERIPIPHSKGVAMHSSRPVPGTMEVREPPDGSSQLPRVINFRSQYLPGRPQSGITTAMPEGVRDDATQREEWFRQCLGALDGVWPPLRSVAFPENIGCGLAGGDWSSYELMITMWAEAHPQTRVHIVKWMPEEHEGDSSVPRGLTVIESGVVSTRSAEEMERWLQQRFDACVEEVARAEQHEADAAREPNDGGDQRNQDTSMSCAPAAPREQEADVQVDPDTARKETELRCEVCFGGPFQAGVVRVRNSKSPSGRVVWIQCAHGAVPVIGEAKTAWPPQEEPGDPRRCVRWQCLRWAATWYFANRSNWVPGEGIRHNEEGDFDEDSKTDVAVARVALEDRNKPGRTEKPSRDARLRMSHERLDLMSMKQSSMRSLLLREYSRLRRKGLKRTTERTDAAHQEAKRVLDLQYQRYAELLSVETWQPDVLGQGEIRLMHNKQWKDELPVGEVRPLVIERIQQVIPMASACAGYGDALGKAALHSGVGRLVLTADPDPFAREETQRVHAGILTLMDCRDIKREHLESKKVQWVHCAFPCEPFSRAGSGREYQDEDARLLEPVSEVLVSAYDGMGIPIITFENVCGYEKGNRERIRKRFEKIFPKYHIGVWTVRASEMMSPLDGKLSPSTNERIWVTMQQSELHDVSVNLMEFRHVVEGLTAKSCLDTDKGRRQCYQEMPQKDWENTTTIELYDGKVHRVAQLCEREHQGPGTGGFPNMVRDWTQGCGPTVIAGQGVGWVRDTIAGRKVIRKGHVVEGWKMYAARDVGRALQEDDNPLAWLALSMSHPQNVADCVWTSLVRAYTKEQDSGSAERRFLRKISSRLADLKAGRHGLERQDPEYPALHASTTFREECSPLKPVMVEEEGDPICSLCWDYFQKVEGPADELQDKFCSQCLTSDYLGCLKEQQRWAKEQKAVVAALSMQEEVGSPTRVSVPEMPEDIFFYDHRREDFGFLSQFYPSVFEDADGAVYHCAEQWMMASKAKIMGDKVTHKLIMEAEYDPMKIRRLGRAVTPWVEERWTEARERVVLEGNLKKFRQNPTLKQKLLDSGERRLVECSRHDLVWGNGLSEKQARAGESWRGLNLLGKCLMGVREQLRSEEEDSVQRAIAEFVNGCIKDSANVGIECAPGCEQEGRAVRLGRTVSKPVELMTASVRMSHQSKSGEGSELVAQACQEFSQDLVKQVVRNGDETETAAPLNTVKETVVITVESGRPKVLVSMAEDALLANPTARYADDEEGSPWLHKLQSSHPEAWTRSEKHELGEWMHQVTTEHGQVESCVEVAAQYVYDGDSIKDRRHEEASMLKGDESGRDPMNLPQHRSRWVSVLEVLETEAEAWVNPRQMERTKMALVEAIAAMHCRGLPIRTSVVETIRDLYDGTYLTRGRKRADQLHVAVKSRMWIRAGKQTAVGAEVLDWYGLPSKTPEVDETEAEATKGSEVRYALGSEPTLVERGMVSPYGTVPAGVHTLMIHVANHSRHHQVLQKGARLGDIEGRVDLAPQQDSGRLLPKCYRDAIKKRRSVDTLTHATDIEGKVWQGKKVLVNVLDYGDAKQQEQARIGLEARGADELVLIQMVDDEAVLEPWKAAGYKVERLDPSQRMPFGSKKHLRKPKKPAEECQSAWLIEKQFDPEAMKILVGLLTVEERDKEAKSEESLRKQIWERIGDEGSDLTDEQKHQMLELLMKFKNLFDPRYLGRVKFMEAEINTGDALPVHARPYRLSPGERDTIRKEVAKMLKLGVIKPSNSPWASLPVLVTKPDGSKRFCVDYRGVNQVTKVDAMPLPRVDDVLNALQGARYFTNMDATSGFWQMKMKESDQEKTAFITPDGQWCYTVMPFGLINASAMYQRMMNTILAGLTWQGALCYIDDVNCYTKTFEEHLEVLEKILSRFEEAGLTLKIVKCIFAASKVELLGHITDGMGQRPSPKKTQALRDIQPPKSVRQVRAYLGMTGYYRKFVRNYAAIARPLTDLTKKENRKSVAEMMKTPECLKAFNDLREELLKPSVFLYHPDFTKRFRVDLDASCEAIGGVLLQEVEEGVWRPVEFMSKKIKGPLRNDEYAPTHLEAMALQECVNRWRPYLIDKEFDLVTDHSALKSLPTRKIDQNRLVRHQMLMQPYRYRIIYKPGKLHDVPDAMSRLPEPSEELGEVSYEDQIPVLEAEERRQEVACKLPPMDWDDLVCPPTDEDYASDAETVVSPEEVATLPLDVGALVVMGLEIEELDDAETPAVRPCRIVEKQPDSKYHVDREHCLHVGNPTNPGVEMPDNEKLKVLQREDAGLKPLIGYLETEEKTDKMRHQLDMPENELERHMLTEEGLLVRQESTRMAKRRRWEAKREAAKSGKLELRHLQGDTDPSFNEKVYQKIIPAVGNVRAVLMSYFHGSAIRGHPGVRRTVRQMQKTMYWKSMWKDVTKHIDACPCKQDGRRPLGRVLKAPPGAHMTKDIDGPNQMVCVDHADMPTDKEGYQAIQVHVDAHSHKCALGAIKEKTAENTAHSLFANWIQHNGMPYRLHTDGARVMHADVIKTLCRMLGVNKSIITPGNPQGNSPAENMVHRAKLALTNLANKFPTQWRKYLPLVQYALNMTHDDEVGLPPHYAHTGQLPRPMTELEVAVVEESEKITDEEPVPKNDTERKARNRRVAATMMDVLVEATRGIVKERRERLSKLRKADKLMKQDDLQAGEIVWLLDERIKTKRQDEKKLHNPRTGPFRVKSVSEDGQNAVLEMGNQKGKRYNVRLLQKYVSPMAGIYPTAGRGHQQGVPVAVVAHREGSEGDEYLTRYITDDGDVQEWNAWELVPPSLVRDFLHELDGNPFLSRCYTGRKITVFWPLDRKSYPGTILSVKGNLLRILYDDGDQGEAIVDRTGQAVEATAYDERFEAKGLRQASAAQDAPEQPKRRGGGRPKGSKNKEPGKPRKGRELTREVEDEWRQGNGQKEAQGLQAPSAS